MLTLGKLMALIIFFFKLLIVFTTCSSGILNKYYLHVIKIYFGFVDNFIKILQNYYFLMYNNEHESVTIQFFEHLPYKRI